MIELKALTRQFGHISAVDNLSLEVRPGELLAVLGPSGCGKTTMLRLIGGYEHPDSGSIHLNGKDVTSLPPEQRHIGMVFQNYALFPHLTVAGNVDFGLRMQGIGREECRRRVAQALAFVNLPGLESRRPATLSGGQQQRVALARALAIEPEVLLLDEPLANLDRRVREQMRVELRALQQRLSITTILVTHDQEEALTLADRIAILDHGRLIQCGTSIELCLRPASEAVSDFLGTRL